MQKSWNSDHYFIIMAMLTAYVQHYYYKCNEMFSKEVVWLNVVVDDLPGIHGRSQHFQQRPAGHHLQRPGRFLEQDNTVGAPPGRPFVSGTFLVHRILPLFFHSIQHCSRSYWFPADRNGQFAFLESDGSPGWVQIHRAIPAAAAVDPGTSGSQLTGKLNHQIESLGLIE